MSGHTNYTIAQLQAMIEEKPPTSPETIMLYILLEILRQLGGD